MSNTDSPSTSVPIAATTDNPPDWDARSTELLCPLCKYNLRYLASARCPECGFAFSWRELLDAEANRHKYVFEHGRGQNFKSLWRTYWRTCQPRRFWSDLSPAQPVRVFRLMVYWLITAGIVAICFSVPKISQMIAQTAQSLDGRAALVPMASRPGYFTHAYGFAGAYDKQTIDEIWPLPWQGWFWKTQFTPSRQSANGSQLAIYWAMILLSWPWFMLLGLLVFRMSMRQAKILRVHLLRTVIYSCDFCLLLALALVACITLDLRMADGWLAMAGAILCAAFTSYRLNIAFRQYLRVHLPLATVIASQLISLLVVFLLLVQIADFSRRV